MGDVIWKLGLLSLVVQVVTELVQRLGLTRYTLAVAIAVGLVVAITTRTGLLAGFGVSVVPIWMDYLYYGLVLAGGGWAIDLIKKLVEARKGSAG